MLLTLGLDLMDRAAEGLEVLQPGTGEDMAYSSTREVLIVQRNFKFMQQRKHQSSLLAMEQPSRI